MTKLKCPLRVPAFLVLVLAALSFVPGVSLVRSAHAQGTTPVRIGSKAFPESWILGEALASLAREGGDAEVKHQSNLGGTDVVYSALKRGGANGGVDVYPEYTGTIAEAILKAPGKMTLPEIRQALEPRGFSISESLGFNDGYAIAVSEAAAEKYGLRRVSDLAAHPDLRLAFTHEFLERKDGWPGVAAHYGLQLKNVAGIEHALAYEAIRSGQIDGMEIYTTDAQIARLNVRVLEDDKSFFPRYDAVMLYRLDLPQRAPKAFAAMERLVGKIDEPLMIRANGLVALEKKKQEDGAAFLLGEALGAAAAAEVKSAPRESVTASVLGNTARHLYLVAVSLALAVLAGIPLGILAARSQPVAAGTLGITGVLQTIPSLALLAFLIPLLGTGEKPALVALFLYSLLPIVRNTYTGLTGIPPNLLEAAEALGLPPMARLARVTLPMAAPSIMAGIKTSAVINVGTATLAALIGAGGLGDPIWRGIQTVNTDLILQGAVPAAVLALLVQGGFDLLDRLIVPKGLRLKPAGD
jgi:osmoprotectant transport system permease protein